MHYEKIQKEVFERVERIIDDYGPRLAGSQASLNTADDIYNEMMTFADHAHQEEFFVYQGAFLGWIRILVACYVLGIAMLWFGYPVITLGLALLSILILTLQFFLYLPLLDKLYPKRRAKNVYSVIEPTDEVKRQVIISGHHDSAHVFNFFIHQPKLYNMRTTGSIVCVIAMIILSATSIFLTSLPLVTFIINTLLSIGAFLVIQMWFFSSKQAALGAGDNLVATSVALSLGQHYSQQKKTAKGLKHTRLILMSFDAEEEGLRGARDYAKKHQEEFKHVPTYLLNMDCLYDENELFFLTTDLNDFVKLDESLALELVDVASKLNITTKTQKLAFLTGGTDAAELAKVGVHATTLIGMPWTNSARSLVYHTPLDTLKHVKPQVVIDTLKIYKTWIDQIDEK